MWPQLKLFCLLASVLFASLCTPLDALATDYFVRKTGSNANAGTSAGAAWLTIRHALENTSPGDKIYVGAGTYDQHVKPSSGAGALGNPIETIADTDGSQTGDAGDVILTTTSGTNLPLLLEGNISNHDYLTFRGLKITTSGSPGAIVKVKQCVGIVFENCEIYGNTITTTGRGLQVDASNATLRNCSFHNNRRAGLYGTDGATIVVEDSIVYGNNIAGQANDGGIQMLTGATTLTAKRCQIYSNTSNGVISATGTSSASSVTLNNCLIHGNSSDGVGFKSPGALTMRNCTVVDNLNDGVLVDSGTADIINCLLADNTGVGINNNSTVTHTYNLVYGNTSANFSGTTQDATELVDDPQFVSATDYRVRILSPAVNAGADMTGIIDDDIDSATRPYDGAWDVGCYEMAPEGHWKLDETSGTVATDSSGRGNDGTYTNSPTLGTAGTVGTAVEFDGTDDYVEVSDAANLRVTDMTLSAWVYIPTSMPSGFRAIIDHGRNTSNWYGLYKSGVSDVFHFRWGNSGTFVSDFNTTIVPDQWYLVTATYDSSTSEARLYLNGQLDKVVTGATAPTPATGNLRIGRSLANAEEFSGTIDDVRVYNYALSAEEVVELFGGLVGHYKLDETSGTVAADSSGFGNDGTVNGTTAWTSAIYGNGHDLNYTDGEDYVEIPNSPSLENVQEGNYTVAAWFKPNSTPPGTGSDNDAFYGIVLKEGQHCGLTYTNANEFEFDHWITGDVWAGTGTWGTSYPPGKYYHVAGVVDITAGTAKIYVNGALVYTDNFTPGTASREYGTSPWRIGIGAPGASTWGMPADGELDDARIYSRALTDEEVADLYDLQGHWRLDENSGTNANDSSPQGHDGTYNGSPTLAVGGAYPGDVLTAVDLDGTDDEVDLPDMDIDFSYGFSAAFWVKPDDTPSTGQGYAFLDLGNGQDVDEIWLGWFKGVGFQLYMTDTDDGSTLKTIEDNTDFEEGKWVHCVATVDAAGNAILYRNGEVTKSGFNTSIPRNVSRTVNMLGTSPLNDNFPGTLDDVRLYNRPLGASEISELYGLTGHWKMDEGAGSTAADSTPFANNATLNGATWTTDCAGNNGLEFDGLSDTATTNANFDPPETGTIAVWLRSAGNPGARSRPFGVGGDWEVRQESDGTLSFDLGGEGPDEGAGPDEFITTYGLSFEDRWYHIVAHFDAADDSFEVYINGELTDSGTNGDDMVKQLANILSFGTRTGSSEYWEGGMRDFRVYNRWLTGSEIGDLSGLVAYWKLDETSGTTAVDSSANGNDGTYTNGVLLNQTGNIDKAAEFDGSDDYVSVPDHPTLQMDDVFSLSVWIRTETSSNVDRMILNKEGEYEIAISPSNELKWGIANTDPGWSWHATGHVVALGKWTHIAMTYDNGTVVTYANGVPVDTYNGSGAVGDQYTSLNELRLGGRSNNPSGKHYDGRIDDVHIFKRILCPTEVFGQYKDGRPTGIRILKWVEVR